MENGDENIIFLGRGGGQEKQQNGILALAIASKQSDQWADHEKDGKMKSTSSQRRKNLKNPKEIDQKTTHGYSKQSRKNGKQKKKNSQKAAAARRDRDR